MQIQHRKFIFLVLILLCVSILSYRNTVLPQEQQNKLLYEEVLQLQKEKNFTLASPKNSVQTQDKIYLEEFLSVIEKYNVHVVALQTKFMPSAVSVDLQMSGDFGMLQKILQHLERNNVSDLISFKLYQQEQKVICHMEFTLVNWRENKLAERAQSSKNLFCTNPVFFIHYDDWWITAKSA